MSSEVCPFCGKTYKRLKSHLPHCKAAVSSKTSQTKDGTTANHTSSAQLATALTDPNAGRNKSRQTPSVTSPQSKKSKKMSAVSSTPETHLQSASKPSFSLSSAPPTPSAKKKNQELSQQITTAAMPSSATISLSNQSQSPSLSPTISKPKKKSLRALIEAAKSIQASEGLLEATRSASGDLLSGSTPYVLDPLTSRTTAQTDTKTHPDKDTASTNDKPKGGFGGRGKGEIENLSMNNMFLKSGSGHQAKITLQDVKATLGRANNTRQSGRPSILSQIATTQDLGSVIRPGADFSPTTTQTDTKTHPDKPIDHPAFLSTNDKPKGASKMKVLKAKKVVQPLSKAKDTSSSLDSKVKRSSATHGTTHDPSGKIRPGAGLGLVPLAAGSQEDVVSCLGSVNSLSNQLPSTNSQTTELTSVKKESLKSKKASLIPLRHDGSSQLELTSPAAPLPFGHLSSHVSQAKLPLHISMNEGLKVNHHMTGLSTTSPSLSPFSSPHLFPLAPQTLPLRVETLRGDAGLVKEKLQLGVSKQNTADNGTKGALTQQSLGQVRLRELPEWLACNAPSHPRDVVEMVQRGWQWYYKKYIDVKKGGVGGLGMVLAGYCVLSYIWSYPHIKRDRWRKHH